MYNDKKYTTNEEIEKMREELTLALSSKPKPKISIKKLFSNGVFAVLLLFLAFTAFNIYSDKKAGNVPNILGYQLFQVETGSMVPTFPVGSLILNKIPKNAEEIKLNDIITFKIEGNIVTHRIIKTDIDENGEVFYVTKGDNPDNSIDPWRVYFMNILSVNKYKLPF